MRVKLDFSQRQDPGGGGPVQFHGAEVRHFTAEAKTKVQVFINNIVAAVVWSETGTARMDMSGKYMVNDLTKWCGIRTVDEYIFQRTAQYLETPWSVSE